MTTRKNFEICDSIEDAMRDLKSGATMIAGGFGLSGIPETIIEWVRTQDDITDLKMISTEAGDDSWGLGRLYEKNKISRQWLSYIGSLQSHGESVSVGSNRALSHTSRHIRGEDPLL